MPQHPSERPSLPLQPSVNQPETRVSQRSATAVHHAHQAFQHLDTQLSRPAPSLQTLAKHGVDFLTQLSEIEPDLVEAFSDHLKKARQKNRSLSIRDYIATHATTLIAGTPTSLATTTQSVTSLPQDELESRIHSLIEQGLHSSDDLIMLLKLCAELGFSMSITLIGKIEEAIKTFIEHEQNSTSDPVNLLSLLQILEKFSQATPLDNTLLMPLKEAISDLIDSQDPLPPHAYHPVTQALSPLTPSADQPDTLPLSPATQTQLQAFTALLSTLHPAIQAMGASYQTALRSLTSAYQEQKILHNLSDTTDALTAQLDHPQ